MKIYTKIGDRGHSQLFGGDAVRKDDDRLCAYGTLDELNSHLGIVISLLKEHAELQRELSPLFHVIQNQLFDIGSHVALGDENLRSKLPSLEKIEPSRLEAEIDRIDAQLPPLKNFILPGGSVIASHLHVARTVARRAERELVRIEIPVAPEILIFINRLSDFLFVAARRVNQLTKTAETTWQKSI